MLDDSRITRLERVLATRPVARIRRDGGVAEAAVALVLRPRATMELLLIQRAEREADPWSGHMALPGGRRAPGDASLLATALRELEEEVGPGLARRAVAVGALDEVTPRSGRTPPIVVAPYVVAVPPDATARPAPNEVAAALWVPLPALADESAASELLLELESGRMSFPALRYRGHVIWGMTHRILTQFLEIAAGIQG